MVSDSPESTTAQERRAGDPPLRLPLQIPVEFFALHPTVPQYTAASLVLNLSEGGMFIKTTRYVRPGTTVELEFSLYAAEKIKTRAKVVWATEGVSGNTSIYAQGIGLQFVNLPQQALQQIHQLSVQYREFP